jgi:hypothetical protein
MLPLRYRETCNISRRYLVINGLSKNEHGIFIAFKCFEIVIIIHGRVSKRVGKKLLECAVHVAVRSHYSRVLASKQQSCAAVVRR